MNMKTALKFFFAAYLNFSLRLSLLSLLQGSLFPLRQKMILPILMN